MFHIILKRLTALVMTFFMLFTIMPVSYAANVFDFIDFPDGWSAEAVKAAVENGLLLGRTDNELVPKGNLTRAEMATIINRAFGAKIEADIYSYKDVSREAWYYHEIAKAVNMQTFQGDGNALMRPDDMITREEVFAVIARAFVLESSDYSSLSKFYDADLISEWAKPYMSILATKGYVNGDDLGNVNPKQNITREEFAQVMHNIVKTYYTHSGTFSTTGIDSSLIRTSGVILKDVTIDGDLVLGDGVGFGTVVLENVTIKGRLLARGGENSVKLINTTVGENVVVKDVNGIVHFHNYRSEEPFKGIVEHTPATFLEEMGTIVPGGGSSGGTSSGPVTYTYTFEYADGTRKDFDVVEDKGMILPDVEDVGFAGWYNEEYPGELLEGGFVYNVDVNKDKVFKAVYKYNEIHYKEYADNIGTYEELKFEKTAMVGEKVTAEIRSYADAFFDETNSGNILEGKIKTDGSLTLKVFYAAQTEIQIYPENGDVGYTTVIVKAGEGFSFPSQGEIINGSMEFGGWAVETETEDGNVVEIIYQPGEEVVFDESQVTVKAVWNDENKATYRVEHYFLKVGGDETNKGDYILNMGYTKSVGNTIVGSVVSDEKITVRGFEYYYGFASESTGTVTADNRLVLKFYYTRQKVEVRYNVGGTTVNDASVNQIQYVPYGDKFTLADSNAVSKAGYILSGWNVNGEVYAPGASVTVNSLSNITVKPVFDNVPLTTYTVEHYFLKIGGNENNKSDYVVDSDYTNVYSGRYVGATVSAEHLSVKGFTYTNNFEDEEIGQIKSDGSLVLKVYYARNITKIRYNTDGATVEDPSAFVEKKVAFGDKFTLPVANTISKPGHTFGGWLVNGVIYPAGAEITINEDRSIITVEPVFNVIVTDRFTVTLKLNDSVTWKTMTFDKGAKIGNTQAGLDFIKAPAEEVGMKFIGWFTANGTKIDGETVVDKQITAVAKFEPKIEYTVTFKTNDSTYKILSIYENTSFGDEFPVDPDITGYDFHGWIYDGETFDKDTVVNGDITVTAKLTKKVYSVVFEDEDGTEIKTESIEYGSKIGGYLPTLPDKTGYDFVGWYIGTEKINVDYTVEGAVNVTAKYELKKYDVTIDVDGSIDTIPVEHGTKISTILPAQNPEKAGHTFKGWVDSNGNTVDVNETITGPITIKAEFAVNKYKVTFNSYNSTVDIEVEYGTAIGTKAVSAATKPNHTFAYWKDKNGNTYDTEKIIEVIVLDNMEFTAEYTENPPKMFKVNFYVNDTDTTPYDSVEIEENQIIGSNNMPADPIKAGYRFVKWVNAATGNEFNGATKITENVKVVAEFVKVHKVIFKANGQSDITINVEDGKSIAETPGVTLPIPNPLPGYTFVGWYENLGEADETSFTENDVVNGDITVTAKYIKVKFTITFVADGATVDTVTVEYDAAIGVLPTAPDKPGFTFKGWYINVGASDETEITAGYTVVGNMTIEAVYEEIPVEKFKVTFYDGIVVDPDYQIHTIADVTKGSALTDAQISEAVAKSEIDSSIAEFGDYKHEVKPQLVYKDAAGNWVTFDTTVKITADTDVFYAFKNIAANAKIKYGIGQTVTFAAPYEDDTRAADTVKDLLILGRNQVRTAFKKEDIYSQLIEKVASKSGGFLDNEGNVRKVEAKSWIIDIIDSIEIEGEIELYTEDMVNNGTYEQLKPILNQAKDSAYIKQICGGAYDYNKVVAHLNSIRGDSEKVNDFSMKLLVSVRDSAPYQTFLKSFVNKDMKVVVNSNNVFYMRAVSYAVGERHDYDTLKEKIKKSFGAIIDIIGDDGARLFLDEAQQRYEVGAMALCDKIDADATYEASYDAFLTFLLNPIEHVARPVYDRVYEKAMNKIIADNKYYYNENIYLQQLIGKSFDDVRNMLFVPGTVVDETYTGYMLNPNTYNSNGTVNEPGVMKYYDTLLEELILADKAALWYKDNLTTEQLESLKDDILSDVAKSINETNAAVKAFDEDGVIPVIGMKLDKLMSYNAFRRVYSQIEGLVDKAIGKYKSTEFYGETWTAASLEAKFPSIREKIDVALGIDDPVFTADNIVEDDTIWIKLGFDEFVYPDDDSEGTLTLNAFERLFDNDFVGRIAARRYYQ